MRGECLLYRCILELKKYDELIKQLEEIKKYE
jgi:hypothetical protein